jgi:broad specificity phosphatase PhoE
MGKDTQKIIFVRHAHRDTSERSMDNGLSEKGHRQAQELVAKYKAGDLPAGKTFWTSPKRRCIETLSPISTAAGCKARVELLLDEQQEKETHGQFRQRIKSLISKIDEAELPLFLCSHGDLIPEAITALAGVFVDLRKGETAILEKRGNDWRVV